LSISEVMISFVRANARKKPGISAQTAPAAAPAMHIAAIASAPG
jgi:hypothetical protein